MNDELKKIHNALVQDAWDECLYNCWQDWHTVAKAYFDFYRALNGGSDDGFSWEWILEKAKEHNIKRMLVKNKGDGEPHLNYGKQGVRSTLCARIKTAPSIISLGRNELSLELFKSTIKKSKWRRFIKSTDAELRKARYDINVLTKHTKTIQARKLVCTGIETAK